VTGPTGRRLALAAVVGGALFLAAGLSSLPRTLEDIDSVNFALGVESFDVAAHQPHPPGSPVFVALARVSTAAFATFRPGWDRDRRAAAGLAFWSVLAGAAGLFVILQIWITIGMRPFLAFLSAALAVASPLYLFTAGRPLSDAPGLVASLGVQLLWLRGWQRRHARGPRSEPGHSETPASVPRVWWWAALATGFVVGLRSQSMWLTGPFLCWVAGSLAVERRWRDAAALAGLSAAGVLLWAAPLLWDSGGLTGYLAALDRQGVQDFTGVEMLATSPTLWHLASAIHRTFVDPWQGRGLAQAVLGLAVIGLARGLFLHRGLVAMLLLSFWPYLLFHLMFHETLTMRYALPLVVPVAGLAVVGMAAFGTKVAAVLAAAAVTASLVTGVPRAAANARDGAPVFRALQDVQRAVADAGSTAESPTLAMHHQVWWGVQRALDWYRGSSESGAREPFPGDREWRRVVQAWLGGRQAPLWFLADVTRTDLAAFDPRTTREGGRYLTDVRVRGLVGGVRLMDLGWFEIARPRWMLDTGWSITPEMAGVTSADHTGPHEAAAIAYVDRGAGPMRVLVGGRYLSLSGEAAVDVRLDDRLLDSWTTSAGDGGFLRWIDAPVPIVDAGGNYGRLTVQATGADGTTAHVVGLEQFDAAPAADLISALAEGWHEPEANPATGRRWRWMASRARLEVRGAPRDVEFTLEGESPLRYFDAPPTVVVRAGTTEIGRVSPSADFTFRAVVPARVLEEAGGITIETDRTFVPAERSGGADRRRLGLRIYRAEVVAR
jgi:hypothetical protein